MRIVTSEFKKHLYRQQLRQFELAQQLGVTESRLSRWVMGKELISKEMLQKLAACLEAPPAELAVHEDP